MAQTAQEEQLLDVRVAEASAAYKFYLNQEAKILGTIAVILFLTVWGSWGPDRREERYVTREREAERLRLEAEREAEQMRRDAEAAAARQRATHEAGRARGRR